MRAGSRGSTPCAIRRSSPGWWKRPPSPAEPQARRARLAAAPVGSALDPHPHPVRRVAHLGLEEPVVATGQLLEVVGRHLDAAPGPIVVDLGRLEATGVVALL